MPREFIHILYDLSSLDPSTSSSTNEADYSSSYCSASSGGRPCQWLKISAANTVFSFEFPDLMSEGEIKGVNPSFSAPLITSLHHSSGVFVKVDLLMQEGSI